MENRQTLRCPHCGTTIVLQGKLNERQLELELDDERKEEKDFIYLIHPEIHEEVCDYEDVP